MSRLLKRDTVDLLLVFVLTAAALLANAFDRSGLFRIPLGLALALFLPGYAILAAFYPDRSLPRLERLVMTVGLSIALLIPLGLLLNTTQSGLSQAAWLTALGGLVLLMAAVACWRRLHLRPLRSKLTMPTVTAAPSPLAVRQVFALIGLSGAVLLLAGALFISHESAITQPRQGFTQFWLLADQPTSTTLHIGIGNVEGRLSQYRATVTVNDQPLHAWAAIALDDNSQWTQDVTVPLRGGIERIDAYLYRLDQPDTVYRQVTVWLGQSDIAVF